MLVACDAELERRAEPEGEHRARRRHRRKKKGAGRDEPPHRGLRHDRRLPHRRARGPRRGNRMAVPAALRCAGLLREAPRRRGARFLAHCGERCRGEDRARLSRRQPHPPDRAQDREGRRARHRLHAHGARRLPKSCVWSRAWPERSRCAWSSPSASTTGAPCPGSRGPGGMTCGPSQVGTPWCSGPMWTRMARTSAPSPTSPPGKANASPSRSPGGVRTAPTHDPSTRRSLLAKRRIPGPAGRTSAAMTGPHRKQCGVRSRRSRR